MDFPAWIQETRKQKGLSMEECAERAGVTQPAWSKWESSSAEHQFRKETVVKIADALGANRSDALTASGRHSSDPDLELGRRLWPILMQAPVHKRGQIEQALESMARTLVETAA